MLRCLYGNLCTALKAVAARPDNQLFNLIIIIIIVIIIIVILNIIIVFIIFLVSNQARKDDNCIQKAAG